MRDRLFQRIDTTLEGMGGARRIILVLCHAVVLAACYLAAEWLRFDFTIPPEHRARIGPAILLVTGVQLLVGLLFRFYRGWWRYVSADDVVRLALGLSTALVVLLVLRALSFLEPLTATPVSTLVVDWALALLGLFGARISVRLIKTRIRPVGGVDGPPKRVLIVGAGDAAEALARELERQPQLGVTVVGFVDDRKRDSYIRGLPVRGPIETIGRIARQYRATEALIALPNVPGGRVREIVKQLTDAGLRFRTVPGVDQLMNGRIDGRQLRDVNLDDLLRRAPIGLPGDPVRSLIEGKRVLITGAGGTIGAELARQVLEFQPEAVYLVDRSEQALYEVNRRLTAPDAPIHPRLLDIRDEEAVRAQLRDAAPHFVLHAAAHKHVPLAEANPLEYLRNNCLAALQFAQACHETGVERFVFISTDKAINPAGIMGATKRAAEIGLLDAAPAWNMRVSIVRFGNVIGSSGSVVPLFMEQIAAGGPITVTHPDASRYFLRTSEAVALVLQTVALGDGSVYMLDMGQPVNIADLARDLIRVSSFSNDEIEIVFTGLRPGEKLVEQVEFRGETVQPTIHPQIVVTQPPQPERQLVAEWLQRARRVASEDGARSVIPLLRELLPDYRPDRS